MQCHNSSVVKVVKSDCNNKNYYHSIKYGISLKTVVDANVAVMC